jgi:hypothetical protein
VLLCKYCKNVKLKELVFVVFFVFFKKCPKGVKTKEQENVQNFLRESWNRVER